jgi:hypothetical protein
MTDPLWELAIAQLLPQLDYVDMDSLFLKRRHSSRYSIRFWKTIYSEPQERGVCLVNIWHYTISKSNNAL